jgi:type IV secretion system protein VirB8
MVRHQDLESYFQNARRWEQDMLLSAQRSKRLAWTVAAVASALAVVSVGAVAALAPLKTVEPFVIRVDNATGIVDAVSALKDTSSTYGEAVARYFLAKYVRAREGFARAEAEANFRTVSLLSGQGEQQRFAAYYRGSNPESPQVVYGRSGVAEVRIKTISLLGPGLASVRYLRETRKGEDVKTSHWIATVTFDIRLEVSISTQDRLVNPIGFLVSEYHADPEVLP